MLGAHRGIASVDGIVGTRDKACVVGEKEGHDIRDFLTTQGVTDEEKERLLKRLASRLTESGSLRIVASDTRSQFRNREIAVERLEETDEKALQDQKKRRPTRRPRAADEARLTEKKKHSEKKRERQRRVTE